MKLLFQLLIVAALAGTAIAGDLKWEQSTIEVKAEKGQKKVEAEFTFINTANEPVKIQSVQTSCGCTTANLAKKEYLPNESGTLNVIFSPEGRKGLQKKSIVVRSGSEQPDVLTLKVEMPDTFKQDKEKLSWKVNAPSDAQSIEFTPDGGKFEVKSVRSLSPDFVATMDPLTSAGAYRVRVVPQSTAKAERSKLCVEVADPGKRLLYVILEIQ